MGNYQNHHRITPEKNQQLMANAWASACQKTQEALNKRGVTRDLVAQRIKQGLNAKKTTVHFDSSPGGSGSFEYSKALVDHGTRLGYTKLAAQLLEMEPAEKKEISFNEDTLNAILTALPGEFAAGVRTALIAAISDKRG